MDARDDERRTVARPVQKVVIRGNVVALGLTGDVVVAMDRAEGDGAVRNGDDVSGTRADVADQRRAGRIRHFRSRQHDKAAGKTELRRRLRPRRGRAGKQHGGSECQPTPTRTVHRTSTKELRKRSFPYLSSDPMTEIV